MSDNIKNFDTGSLRDESNFSYLLECEHCGKKLSSKSALNYHQKTAKYCLEKQNLKAEKLYNCSICDKSFILKDACKKHEEFCTPLIKLTKKELIKKIEILQLEYDNLIENNERMIQAKDELIEKYEQQIQTLEQSISNIALKASTKPTTSNTTKTTKNKTIINNLPPFSYDDLKACADALTIEHIEKGIEGHAQLIMPFLKGKIKCTDSSRRTIKYNNGDETITDPKGLKVISAYSKNIYPRNEELTKEYRKILNEKLKSSEPIESVLLIEQGFKAENLNDQIKGAAKGEDTKFVTKLSGKISMAVI